MEEKRAACRAIFHRVDIDRSGYIDASELVQLQNLTAELGIESNQPEITVEDAFSSLHPWILMAIMY